MNFAQAISSGFRNYVGFTGRACRSEFWFWQLYVFVASICLSVLDLAAFASANWSPLSTVFSLAILLPGIAVGARRLHDINKSGFWLFLWFLPIIGWIIMIVWAIKKGDQGDNRFGSDPLAALAAQPAQS